ncbi:MAG: S-layer homology domain-containing protein [Eubacteriales bacterium]
MASREEDYRNVVQEYVNQYGVIDGESLREMDLSDPGAVEYKGLISVQQWDFTGDGEDELLLLWQPNPLSLSDIEAPGMGVSMAIYGYGTNGIEKLYQANDVLLHTGVSQLSICSIGDRHMLLASSTRHFTDHAIYYKDGTFVDLMADDTPYSPQEQAIYEEGCQYGLSGEAEAVLKIFLNRAGLDADLPQYVDGVFSEGAGLFGLDEYESLMETLHAWNVKLPKKMVSAQQMLNQIAYVGDKSICKMDAQMAGAYADAIASLPQEQDGNSLYAVLADPANDGMPILITVYLDKNNITEFDYEECSLARYGLLGQEMPVLWQYVDGKAQKTDAAERAFYINGFGKIGNTTVFRWIDFFHDVGHNRTGKYYSIANGRIQQIHMVEVCDVYGMVQDGEKTMYGDLPAGATYQLEDEAALQANGWIKRSFPSYDGNESFAWYYMSCDGKNVTGEFRDRIEDNNDYFDHDDYVGFVQTSDLNHINDVEYHFALDNIKASTAIAALREYADAAGRPVYSYPEVSHLFNEEQLEKIAQLFAQQVNGQVGEIYRIGDDLYYIVLYVDGKTSGCAVVKEILVNGKTEYRLISASKQLAEEAALNEISQQQTQMPNLKLEYGESGEDKAAYLQEALSNLDGTTVNDAGKGMIATYIENAVTESSMVDVKSSWNKVTITDETITSSLEQAQAQKDSLEQIVGEISLNKEVTIVLRIVCTGLNEGKTIEITFDPSMLEALKEADAVQVMLGDAQHSIKLETAALEQLCTQYGTLTVRLQNQDGAYLIGFVDAQDNDIAQLVCGVTFTLPAQSETATILASYGDVSDNWGGQYDSLNGAIEFATPYSGTYQVMENAEEIADLAELDEEMASAIRFMVSKGYFSLDEQNRFQPNGELNRYQFAQALVKMFFALDRSLTTSFTDVPRESEYYAYVASGEQDDIIEGFEDGTFRGETPVLREQVIAFCSRTLADKKGYSYPENPNEYLSFTDNDAISDWAIDTTALAARETLIESGGTLEPQQAIARGEAALMLYRLFMLLYEPPVTVMEIEDTGMNIPMLPIAVGGSLVLLAGAVGGIWYFRKRSANLQMQGVQATQNKERGDNQ